MYRIKGDVFTRESIEIGVETKGLISRAYFGIERSLEIGKVEGMKDLSCFAIRSKNLNPIATLHNKPLMISAKSTSKGKTHDAIYIA